MSAPQGWYDAGTPGVQRWWDGVQWTAHERAAAPATLSMGWYPVPGTTDVRWWDGVMWTPYRVRAGKPRPDWLAIEPPAMGVVLGVLFVVLGMLQLFAALVTQNPGNFVFPVLLLSVAVIWFVGAAYSSGVRKLPAPQSAPIVDPVVRPLPGEVEGPGAGWYPMTRQVSRWWTGSRWSWYIGTKFGPRPGHAGPRGYLTSMIVGWCVAGLAVAGLIVAVLGSVIEQGLYSGAMIAIGIIVTLLFGGLAAFALLLTRSRRNALLLPTTPPPLR
ncbi:DUF2510 domain-containing protein [Microbacterium phyllosphaerae]